MDIKKLRKDYQKMIGKRPFPGWTEEQLLERMQNKPAPEPAPEPIFDFEAKLSQIFWAIGDGKYRREVKNLIESKPDKAALIQGLTKLKQLVSEGELKAMLQSHIDTI